MQINGKQIDVVAHCIEVRTVYAYNKEGKRLISFIDCVDYSKDNNSNTNTVGTCIKQIEQGMKMPKFIPDRHGVWILERELDGTSYCFHCSACDSDFQRTDIQSATDYCPNCGARMTETNEKKE